MPTQPSFSSLTPSPFKGEGLCQRGGRVSAPPFVLPPPRWGSVGVGVMRAECIDSVENRSKPRGGAWGQTRGWLGGSGDALEDGVEEFGAALFEIAGGIAKHRLPVVAEDQVGAERRGCCGRIARAPCG